MENSEGLFALTCECDTIYAPELKKCPSCGKGTQFQKHLELKYDLFFEKVYSLLENKKRADGIDLVYDVFFELYNRFDIMNDILSKIDTSKLTGGVLVSLMSQTFKYRHDIPAHTDYCNRAAVRLRELGSSEKEIDRYMKDFRDVDVKRFWGDMAAYGAPNGLFGVGPGKLEGDSK